MGHQYVIFEQLSSLFQTNATHCQLVLKRRLNQTFSLISPVKRIQPYHYATRRRFERTCQSDGIYASDKHSARSDKYLLVLLLRPEGMEYRHRRRG